MQVIHWSLTLPLLVLGAAVLFLNGIDAKGATEELSFLYYLPGGFLIIFWPLSLILFRYLIREIPAHASLDQKLMKFQSAHLVRMAFMEAIALVSVLASFLTATNENLLIIAIVLGMFFNNRPDKVKIAQVLQLTAEDQAALEEG